MKFETKYQKNVSQFTSYSHTTIQMEGKSPIKPIKKFTKILNHLMYQIYICLKK